MYRLVVDPAGLSLVLTCDGVAVGSTGVAVDGDGRFVVDVPEVYEILRAAKSGGDLGMMSRASLDQCDRCLRLVSDGERHGIDEVREVMNNGRDVGGQWVAQLLIRLADDGHILRLWAKGDAKKKTVAVMAASMLVASRRGPVSLAESECTPAVGEETRRVSRAEARENGERILFEVLADGKWHRIDQIVDAMESGLRNREADRRHVYELADSGRIRQRPIPPGQRAIGWFALKPSVKS